MLTLGRILKPKSLTFISSLRIATLSPTQDHPNSDSEPPEPTSAYYDDLVNEAGRSRDFALVRQLLIRRIRDGCFNSNDTFRFITKTPTSLSFVDDLFETLARLPKGYTRKSAFDSLNSRLCKLQLTDDALKVVDKMLERGLELNACSFHPILNALTKKKEMEAAWNVVGLMKENGVEPDTTAYNYLLTAYCAVGDVISAANLLRRLSEEGLKGDTRTYDAMVLGACRAGKVDGAMAVLRAAEDDGVPLLYSTHAHVINALLELGFHRQAVNFVMSYGGKDKSLDTESFGLLASRLIKLEKVEDAKLVLDEMRRRGLHMGEKLRDFYLLHI
ncbi:hypothetical protein Ancab_017918 [Ancistrocladus abbreviatus]